MKYVGSKSRVFKYLLPIISDGWDLSKPYVEPFVGGANAIVQVNHPIRLASDNNRYLIALWTYLQSMGADALPTIDRKRYNYIKNNPKRVAPWLVGYAAICCSYSGKWWGGFAGEVQTKQGVRNYQSEAQANIRKQLPYLKDVDFSTKEYHNVSIPKGSTVYCDPPYLSTLGYHSDFDHDLFWDWVRNLSRTCRVFVSEYQAPSDFESVFSMNVGSSLSANGIVGGRKQSIEQLWVVKSM